MGNPAGSVISVEKSVEERLGALISRSQELLTSIRNSNQRIRVEAASNRMLRHGEDGSHRLDDQDLVSRQSVDLGVLTAKMEELRNVEIAIQQIKKGKEDHCVDCGRKIPAKRLEAKPDAVRCRSCQEEQEEFEEAKKSKRLSPHYLDDDD